MNLDDWKKGIKPLKQKNISPYFSPEQKQKNWRKIEAQIYRPAQPVFQPLNLEPIDPQRFEALRRGWLHIHQELDLHGFFVDEALRFLQDILDERDNFQPEIWVIIHGKGRNSEEQQAVLKQAVWDFLQQHHAVSAIAPVMDSRLESGAIYVAVKSRRRR